MSKTDIWQVIKDKLLKFVEKKLKKHVEIDFTT
jgi:tRNA A37 threonylcarbamoyladenosine dehydratase